MPGRQASALLGWTSTQQLASIGIPLLAPGMQPGRRPWPRLLRWPPSIGALTTMQVSGDSWAEPCSSPISKPAAPIRTAGEPATIGPARRPDRGPPAPLRARVVVHGRLVSGVCTVATDRDGRLLFAQRDHPPADWDERIPVESAPRSREWR